MRWCMSTSSKPAGAWVVASWVLLGWAVSAVIYYGSLIVLVHLGVDLGVKLVSPLTDCVFMCWWTTLLGWICAAIANLQQRPRTKSAVRALRVNAATWVAVTAFIVLAVERLD